MQFYSAQILRSLWHVRKLLSLKPELLIKKIKNRRDLKIIKKSGLFNEFFACSGIKTCHSGINEYWDLSKKGYIARKPMPGFHPGIYSEENDVKDRDPFAHFIRLGKPAGNWSTRVIYPDSKKIDLDKSISVGCHLHLHYFNHAEDIITLFKRLEITPDLLISVTSPNGKEHVEGILKNNYSARWEVRITPNRGRDLGPFLTEFSEEIKKYSIIGHFHAKESHCLNDQEFTNDWNKFIFENLVAGKHIMGNAIFKEFHSKNNLGLVYADDPHIINWTKNLEIAKKIAGKLKINKPIPNNINFPIGTMFWARPIALRPLFELNLRWEDYPPEPLGYDGTMLHAIERLIPLVVAHAGYSTAVTHVPGVSR